MTFKPYILVIDDEIGIEGADQNNFLERAGATGKDNEPIADFPYRFEFLSGLAENGSPDVNQVTGKVKERWPDKDRHRWALILLDIKFNGQNNFGIDLLKKLRDGFGADLPIIMLTQESETLAKSPSNQLGADGFLPKTNLSQKTLDDRVNRFGLFPDVSGALLGKSLVILKTLRSARQLAFGAEGNITLLGQTGTGKSALAEYIWNQIKLAGDPKAPLRTFFANPANPELDYCELFGHWHGAHSHADCNAAGCAESSHKGVLLIDEVAELALQTQAMLLSYRHLDLNGKRVVRRKGNFNAAKAGAKKFPLNVVGDLDDETGAIYVKTVLICATNVDLEDDNVRHERKFRNDLWGAMEGTILRLPTLAERKEDIPDLFANFLNKTAIRKGRSEISLDASVITAITTYEWPRNVQELKNTAICVARNLGDFDEVQRHHLPEKIVKSALPGKSDMLPDALATGTVATPVATTVASGDIHSEYVKITLAYLRQRADLLKNALESTRKRTGDYSPTEAVGKLLGQSEITTADAVRKIKEILKDIRDPNLLDKKVLDLKGLAELSGMVSNDPVLAEFYAYALGNKTLNAVNNGLNPTQEK